MQLSPHDGVIGIVEVLLYVLGSGGAALAAAFITARHARNAGQPVRDQVAELVASVSNGHSKDQPLRTDIDKILASVHSIRSAQIEIRTDLQDLREELRIERDELAELQHKVADLAPRRRRRDAI
jgi:septal ring factor EnvC (AmiA/AmiB activator)